MTRETKKLAMQVKKLAIEISKRAGDFSEFDEDFIIELGGVIGGVLERYLNKDAREAFPPEKVRKYFEGMMKDYRKIENKELKSVVGKFLMIDLKEFYNEYLAFRKSCEKMSKVQSKFEDKFWAWAKDYKDEEQLELEEFDENFVLNDLAGVIGGVLERYLNKDAREAFPPEKVKKHFEDLIKDFENIEEEKLKSAVKDFFKIEIRDFYNRYLEFRKACEKLSKIQSEFENRL